MQDERERLRAAGFTDAEIDAELGPKRPTVRVAAESSSMQGPGKAPARAGADLEYVKGLARQGAQGATLGFADEGEAGLRALASGGKYKELRDAIRAKNDAFAAENPKAALAATIAGGVLTGGAVAGAAKGAGTLGTVARMVAPRVDATASLAARVGQAARVGGLTGAVGGWGAAKELRDVPTSAAIGGGIGAAGGALFAGVGDAVRGARNLAGQALQRGNEGGALRRIVQAETPEIAGARRVLRAAGRAGQTLDELAAADEVAPASRAFGELIKDGKGVGAMRTMRNAGRNRDALDASLAERSAETPAMWSRTLSRETGVPTARDAKSVAEEALTAIRPTTRKLYRKGMQQPDVADERIAQAVETLQSMPEYGPAALKRARTLAAARGDAFPETFRPEGAPAGVTRTAGGRLKDFAKASDDALLDEYEAITTRMQRDMGESVYNFTEINQGGGNFGTVVPTATKSGAGPSMQAKALRRLEQSQGVLARIESELEKRGKYVEDELARRTMNQSASASGDLADVLGDAPLEKAASVNPVRVADMLRLRKGVDEVLRTMKTEIDGGKGSPELFEAMSEIRRSVNAAAKDAGGKYVRKADRLTRQAKARGESFAQGGRVNQAGTAEGVARLAREARDPEAFREGSASKLLERAAGISDGEAGQVRNPVQGPLGSETRRARTRTAFPDDASFERARAEAAEIVNYLRTQRAVSGNSTTAANLAEMADEFGVDPATIIQHAANPTQLALAIFKDRGRALASGTSAAQADEASRFLFAGLPGQMPRNAARTRLQELAPAITNLMTRQALIRGGAGGMAGRAASDGR
jgi:hypothetical protein